LEEKIVDFSREPKKKAPFFEIIMRWLDFFQNFTLGADRFATSAWMIEKDGCITITSSHMAPMGKHQFQSLVLMCLLN
jgi:hypothetical protein